MLTENEWNIYNNMLLELYTIDDISIFTSKIMKIIKILIPYSKGWFLLLNEDNQIVQERSCFTGFSEDSVRKYINTYYNEDYVQYLYDFTSETTVYKDTSILESEHREKTNFYLEYLRPEDIIYGSGILIIRNSRITGMFNLFRNEDSGDFSQRDLYILGLLKKHLENMIHNIIQLNRANISVSHNMDKFASDFGLTSREEEILSLINKGKSNQEISSELVISLSTVKKHIYNLYAKIGVSSRSQLISHFLEQT